MIGSWLWVVLSNAILYIGQEMRSGKYEVMSSPNVTLQMWLVNNIVQTCFCKDILTWSHLWLARSLQNVSLYGPWWRWWDSDDDDDSVYDDDADDDDDDDSVYDDDDDENETGTTGVSLKGGNKAVGSASGSLQSRWLSQD